VRGTTDVAHDHDRLACRGRGAASVAGCLALFPPNAEQRAQQLFGVYLVSLGLMIVFLRLPYMEHVGFTLIALWDGFVIVLAIDLGAPGWPVIVLAVLGVVVGNRALHWAEARAGELGSFGPYATGQHKRGMPLVGWSRSSAPGMELIWCFQIP
jgi:hypothetical protein